MLHAYFDWFASVVWLTQVYDFGCILFYKGTLDIKKKKIN